VKKQGSLGGKGTEGSPDTQFMDKGVWKERWTDQGGEDVGGSYRDIKSGELGKQEIVLEMAAA